MEDKHTAMNTVLGLELNRLFFVIESQASKQKVIDFARTVLESERQQRLGTPSPQVR
jgi:hypothetical protein